MSTRVDHFWHFFEFSSVHLAEVSSLNPDANASHENLVSYAKNCPTKILKWLIFAILFGIKKILFLSKHYETFFVKKQILESLKTIGTHLKGRSIQNSSFFLFHVENGKFCRGGTLKSYSIDFKLSNIRFFDEKIRF